MPCPSTPLPPALFKSISYVLVRTSNNIGPYIYPWGMLLITVQTSYCGSQDTEPSDEASFLCQFISYQFCSKDTMGDYQTSDLSQGVQHFPTCTQGQAEISLNRHYLSQSLYCKSALDLCILCHLLLAWAQQETHESTVTCMEGSMPRHSSNLLSCLHPGLFPFQQLLGWWKSPM